MLRSCLASVTLLPGSFMQQRPEELMATQASPSLASLLLHSSNKPRQTSFPSFTSQMKERVAVPDLPQQYAPFLGATAFAAVPAPVPVADMIPALSDMTAQAVENSNITIWVRGKRIIFLLGSLHFSSKSAELVGQIIRDVVPDAVFLELCPRRVVGVNPTQALGSSSIKDSESTGMEAGNVEAFFLSQHAALQDAGYQLGGEFVRAVDEGDKVGASLILGDQDLSITNSHLSMALKSMDPVVLQRAHSEWVQKTEEMWERKVRELEERGLLQQVLLHANCADISEEDFERMSEEDRLRTALKICYALWEELLNRKSLTQLINEAKVIAPTVVHAFLTERDEYMANGLASFDQYQRIVAVVGMAHLDGIEQNLKEMGWEQVRL